jgi:hypothetical protein
MPPTLPLTETALVQKRETALDAKSPIYEALCDNLR